MEPVYRPVIHAAKTLFRLQGTQFTMTGTENVPREGGAVMAINHTSYLDFMYAGLPAWPHRRYVRFMAKQSIFAHRVSGPLMRGMRHIPVDRHQGGQAFKDAVRALKDGEIVGVFPEATMSRSFELKEFKPGAVKMAQVAGVPVLPVTIWGGHRVWTKDLPKRMGRAHIPVHIAVGEPIEVGRREDVAEATARVKAAMQAQLDAQQAAYPELVGDERRYLPARLGGTAPTPEESHEADASDMRRTRDKFTG
ncbi:MAG: 1-acyl-sn-glycerol-3-phosphate acyltransferase [Micrococcales bacterium]|uniref:lysophospholipid acyltransferase family protein n=1 Tax=Phycicoccus sp. TaxID=1902410 RepID=UPI00198C2524|nr:lysophospholipid acyltransferase family protein [Phycicoccus sp.]MBD3783855.1 1-acyl-sn-glycerol-3-phosphate acyltransferase [Micrococcales bacterium]HMM93838.1 lysophospholipid acyltransferase family protein [Phycicoccus sp.]